MILDPAEYRALLRLDFHAFVERCFYQLHQVEFQPNWHIEILCARMAACRTAPRQRLIVNVPPRSLKSLVASVALPAWLLGHDPGLQVVCVSYAQDFAAKLALDCRSVMTSDWYRVVFPRTRVSAAKQAVSDFMTTANGSRMATSVGGVLTGRGADLIVIDDPLKPDEAVSDTQRGHVNAWYDNTLVSRLNDKTKGSILLVMQRLHEDDLAGHVQDQEPWDRLCFPAIAEEHETHTAVTSFGVRTFTRAIGEALHPAREPLEILQALRRTMGEYNFAGQYQQAPSPLGGGMVRDSWFPAYALSDLPETFDRVVQSWDTANKSTELSDYSVCTTWGVRDKRHYLLHVLRKRLDFPSLKRAVVEQARLYDPETILIEDKASGTQLIQDLVHDGVRNIQHFMPEGDKIMRLHSQTATIENGFVLLPKEAPWLAEYRHEMTTFPNGRHDDQVDSTSQFLSWYRTPEPGILVYYRQLIEERDRATREVNL